MKTTEKLNVSIGHEDLSVFIKRHDSKGKFIESYSIINPLQLADPNSKYTPEEKREILDMLYKTKKCPDSERIEFKSEEEFDNYIARLNSAIDPYTQYIENGTQQEQAEKSNERIRNIIEFVKEYEFVPERISTKDFKDYYLKQAFAMIDGVEKNNGRYTMLYAIDWMKRMGFQKVRNFPNSPPEDIVRYVKSVDSSDLKFDYEMCFEISKNNDGKYQIKFYYDFYDFRSQHCINEASLYTPVFMRKGTNMIDSKSRSYSYR